MMYIDITNQYLLQFKYMYMMRLIYIFLYHAASWVIWVALPYIPVKRHKQVLHLICKILHLTVSVWLFVRLYAEYCKCIFFKRDDS